MTTQAQETKALETPKPRLVEQAVEPTTEQENARPKRRFWRWLTLLAVLVLVAAGGAWWLRSLQFQTTDDAQVEGHLDSISSRI